MQKSTLYASLYRWWNTHRRELPWRETTDPYRIWLSEIILQQTRVQQGMEYYHRFVDRFPTVGDLARADEQEVMRLWQGLGYYTRCRNLMRAAKDLSPTLPTGEGEQCGFPPPDGDTEGVFEKLRRLPGVGDYTAGAIAAFAYNLPYPALDGNVYRVLSRLYDCEIPFDTTEGKKHFRALAEELLDRDNPRLFDSAIMELGALHCLPTRPDCETCPLGGHCLAHAHGTVELLPVRKPRPKVIEREMNYTIFLTPDRRTLIHRREDRDIWQGLWEFTEMPTSCPDSPVAKLPNERPAVKTVKITHILSHRKIIATFSLCPVEALPEIEGAKAVRWDELDDYGMPQLMIRAREKLGL